MATRQSPQARRPAATPRVRRPAAGLLALLAITCLVAGCVPPAPRASGRPEHFWALNALDGTLTPLDGERAVAAGPPIAAGDAPAQAAAGPGGSVLVLSFSRDRPGGLTHVVPDRGAWRARPVPLDGPLHQAALAADGRRYAAVAHHTPSQLAPDSGPPGQPSRARAGPCLLTLLDLATGETRTHAVCAPGEQLAGVALGAGPDGPVAYLGVWDARGPQDDPQAGPPRAAPGAAGSVAPRQLRDRVVALDARTGRVLAARALASPPEHLQLVAVVPAPGEPEGRLYVLEGAPGPESDYSTAGRWRLLGLHPVTLETEQEAFLGGQVRALAVAPGGGHAYALAAGGQDVLHVDLAAGRARRLGGLPGPAAGGPTVTGRHVLVANPLGSEVWALDRRDGRLAATVPVGRRPVAVISGRP